MLCRTSILAVSSACLLLWIVTFSAQQQHVRSQKMKNEGNKNLPAFVLDRQGRLSRSNAAAELIAAST
jgi:hypothetical protein